MISRIHTIVQYRGTNSGHNCRVYIIIISSSSSSSSMLYSCYTSRKGERNKGSGTDNNTDWKVCFKAKRGSRVTKHSQLAHLIASICTFPIRCPP